MKRRVYLDYAATTPVHPKVRESMLAALGESFGNPSSLHWAGQEASQLVGAARTQVAQALGAAPEEILFTSGATESDNLALRGLISAKGKRPAHLITSAVEHHAVLHTADALRSEGHEVTLVPVDAEGLVDPDAVRHALRPNTVLVSIMMVNNEVGAVQPVAEIGKIAHERGIYFHTDAVQGIGFYDVDVDALNADLLSLSAHKIYGPKGVGALYVRRGTPVHPLLFGGMQERQLRAGTENVPGIIGLGAAMALTSEHKHDEHQRLAGLRHRLVDGIAQAIPKANVNGPASGCAPHIASISFPGADGEMILFHLNAQGVAASMGSACSSKSIEASHVLVAMGLPPDQIQGTIRFSLGYPSTMEDVEYLLEILPQVVEQCQVA